MQWRDHHHHFLTQKSCFFSSGECSFFCCVFPQVLEEQLEQERRRTTLDFSDRDFKMKSEYEKRLKSELKGLRKKYRQETERTKNEFMNLHLKKVPL